MMMRNLSPVTIRKMKKIIPEMEIITLARAVAMINVDVWQNGWSQNHQIMHEEHALAMGFLQGSFKNHLMDIKGLQAMEGNIQRLQNSQYNDLADQFSYNKKMSEKGRKNIFLVSEDPLRYQKYFYSSSIMKSPNYRKIICFPKDKPISMDTQFQKFCRTSSVQALGLRQMNLHSILGYIMRKQKLSTLVHGIIMDDVTPYQHKYQDGQGVKNPYIPQQLLFFCNQVKEKPKLVNPTPTITQILKNYMNRGSFSQISATESTNFSIQRFTHLREVKKNLQQIAIEQGILDDD